MFGRVLLKPEIGREPVYDSVYNQSGRSQTFTCIACSSEVPVDVARCMGVDACDPETVLGPEHGDAVREHFGILQKSLANGWPFVKVHSCPNCGCRYLVYVAALEPRNGWQQGILQGITELLPSNSNVRTQMTTPWPTAAYFNHGTAAAQNILAELTLIAQEGWYELYQRKSDGSYWRLDADDKYQQRFLISIENLESWQSFDATHLEKLLLLQSRSGVSSERCRWKTCQEFALIGSAFCVDHTYQMGMRK